MGNDLWVAVVFHASGILCRCFFFFCLLIHSFATTRSKHTWVLYIWYLHSVLGTSKIPVITITSRHILRTQCNSQRTRNIPSVGLHKESWPFACDQSVAFYFFSVVRLVKKKLLETSTSVHKRCVFEKLSQLPSFLGNDLIIIASFVQYEVVKAAYCTWIN